MQALVDARVKRLVLSYDIACQWKQHLRTRVLKILDPDSQLPRLDDYKIQFALPVWHAAAHEVSCQMTHSLSYATGVGRTDGEGIERDWSALNPLGTSVREMGPGSRHDTLDDHFGDWNFRRTVALRKSHCHCYFIQSDVRTEEELKSKLLAAVKGRNKYAEEYQTLVDSLPNETVNEWTSLVTEWEKDHDKPNPYEMDSEAMGMYPPFSFLRVAYAHSVRDYTSPSTKATYGG